jgi:hypothetical protein
LGGGAVSANRASPVLPKPQEAELLELAIMFDLKKCLPLRCNIQVLARLPREIFSFDAVTSSQATIRECHAAPPHQVESLIFTKGLFGAVGTVSNG